MNEIELFLGMLIARGLHQLPAYTDYWSSKILLGVPGFGGSGLVECRLTGSKFC